MSFVRATDLEKSLEAYIEKKSCKKLEIEKSMCLQGVNGRPCIDSILPSIFKKFLPFICHFWRKMQPFRNLPASLFLGLPYNTWITRLFYIQFYILCSILQLAKSPLFISPAWERDSFQEDSPLHVCCRKYIPTPDLLQFPGAMATVKMLGIQHVKLTLSRLDWTILNFEIFCHNVE